MTLREKFKDMPITKYHITKAPPVHILNLRTTTHNLPIRASFKDYEINMVSLNQYIFASQYSRKNFRREGICIFINKNVKFSKINNVANCKE
jgi:hypothetical protein